MSQDIPIYDVTSWRFVPGVTNFSMHHVLAALRSVGIIERKKLFAVIHVAVYDNLQANNMIDFVGDKMKWHQFEIEIDKESDCSQSVVDSRLSDGNKIVILRTREWGTT